MLEITKELMTLCDFIERFSVSRSTVYRELAAGRLRFVKVGRRTYISRKDAETWLQALRTNSVPKNGDINAFA